MYFVKKNFANATQKRKPPFVSAGSLSCRGSDAAWYQHIFSRHSFGVMWNIARKAREKVE